MTKTENGIRLGTFVKLQREARGLSGQALARAVGVDKGYLHRLEAGEVESPDPRKLVRLARALEVDVSDLYLAAGYPLGAELPSMPLYLRAKCDLPESAIAQIEEYIDMVSERHRRREDDDGRAA
jgi:transcriptional regulator with XRE-family HTH domain